MDYRASKSFFMRGARNIGVITAIAVLVLIALYWWKYPNYTYRYRLAIAIEVDGEIHSASSVIEVIWVGQPEFGDVGPFHPRVRGQATFIDLGSHGAVVATLYNGESYGTASDGAVNALWLAANAFGNKSTNDELSSLPRLRGRKDLTPNNMPRLIWLRNVADLMSARKLRILDIPTILSANARLVAAYVEITQAPIVIDIDKKLPWYEALKGPFGGRVIQVEPGLSVFKEMFIGAAT
jgi:hypothetical protein